MYPGPCSERVPAMRRTIPLALLLAGLLAPSSALAANAKISPKPAEVSPAGLATVEAANPNSYVLKGKATVTASGKTIASRTVKLGKRSVGTITLRFDAKARNALEKSGGRATITLKLRRSNGKRMTARRTITLKLGSNAEDCPFFCV